jgi:Na+/proline symporter
LGLNTQEGYFSILEQSPYVSFFNWDVWSPTFFGKQFIGGMFICIAMTGLDQNMMQKNLSCKTPQESQKNMITTAFVVLIVNFLFVSLGVFMVEYLKQVNPAMLTDPSVKTDMYFPIIALQYLGPFAGMAFVLGLSAATFSSADSVLTTLTTSTYFDLLGINAKDSWNDTKKQKVRNQLHILFAFLLLLSILGFYEFSNGAVIDVVLSLANYTYGPLLGLFALGIFTKFKPDGLGIVWVSLIAPILCWILAKNQFITQSLGWDSWNWKYQFGFELILLNGMFSFVGYWLVLKITKRL